MTSPDAPRTNPRCVDGPTTDQPRTDRERTHAPVQPPRTPGPRTPGPVPPAPPPPGPPEAESAQSWSRLRVSRALDSSMVAISAGPGGFTVLLLVV
ncbi:hypothetical protein SALB_03890 [Streptomyces noursei]|uniref:Uncharacterized protein n=1 Tax=Streptomyces noursei TaxID=1971 RepID=A0A401R0L6_STRNR|nr:hypothetical protein SALB_03890 [Streptomyces noursei]